MDTREADSPTKTAPGPAGPTTAPNGRGAVPPPETNDVEQKRSGPGRRIFFIVGAVIVVALIVFFGVPWLSYNLAHEGTDDARVDADAVAITPRISEKIDRILVNTNDPVKRGQLLFVLDNKDELARLKQAQAQYDLAVANQRATTVQGQGGVQSASGDIGSTQAQVPVAQAGVSQAQAQLRVANSQIPAAAENYRKAVADYARVASLVATGDVPSQQLDAVRAEQASAAAQYKSARDQVTVADANIEEAEQRVNASSASVAAAQGNLTTAQGRLQQAADPSNVEAAKASLDLAKQNLSYTHIYSPIDGYVGEKNVEVGQTVSSGMTLMTLIPHRVYITANYKETQMGKMRVGQPVDITVDAYKGTTFHGHVESINPASQNTYALVPAQNATGNFVKVTQRIPVRITVDDERENLPLRPGMSVETYVKIK